MIDDFLFNMYIAFINGDWKTYLLVAGVSRIIFIFFFVVDYSTLHAGKQKTHGIQRDAWIMNAKDWAWFAGKEAFFIAMSSFDLLITMIVLGYSVLGAGSHLIAAARRSRFKVIYVLGCFLGGALKYALSIAGVLVAGYMFFLDTDRNAPVYFGGVLIAICIYATRSIVGLLKSHRELSAGHTTEQSIRDLKRALVTRVPAWGKAAMIVVMVLIPVGLPLAAFLSSGVDYSTVYLEMDDGTILATDIYKKKDDTIPRPVILMRTPYNKHTIGHDTTTWFFDLVADGYIVVNQDIRGRYASNGSFTIFTDDRADGAKTIAWIKNQSWCNGQVATMGGSAGAITQYCLADEPTGALKFQSMVVGSPEMYDHMAFQGGAFRKAMVESWLYAIWVSNQPMRATEYQDNLDWLFSRPVKNDSWSNASLSLNDRYAGVNTSAIHIGGWYDIFSQGTIDGFVGYNYHGGLGAVGKQRLVMGPNGHGSFGDLSGYFNGASTLEFPAADTSGHAGWEGAMRNAALFDSTIDWNGTNVAYYLMGDVDDSSVNANRWFYANKWPVDHVNQSFYIGNSTLENSIPAAQLNHSYLYDPSTPVLTKGGNNLVQIASLELDSVGVNGYTGDADPNRVEQFVGIGPYDQALAGNLGRDDVLVFSSAALSSPLTVTGRVWANLWVASNCTDTAFTVMLMDEYPDGRSYNVLDGIIVMRSRAGLNSTAPDVVNGSVYEVWIDLWSTAYQFNTGHRVKIAISSSNYPRFERHPNSNAPLSNHPANFSVANNTILTGIVYPSRLVLPVVA